jgi:hypothetical protein
MFYRTLEGLLLKCLGPTEVNRLLHEVHDCHTPFRDNGNEASICVPRMFNSHI